MCQIEVVEDPQTKEPSVSKIIRIGMDTSKSVFQVHGVDENELPVLRRKLRRHQVLGFFAKLEPTVIGMEACGASHYWARQLAALGHKVVLIPPQYVKPYVDRGKNDAADAEAICEAMSRPKVKKRFVAAKTAEQQAAQMLIGVREALLRRRTQVSNAIRGHAAEFGLVAPKGLVQVERLAEQIAQDLTIPPLAREMFLVLVGQYRHANAQCTEIDARLMAFHRSNEQSQRLAEVPAIGPVTAAALAAKVNHPEAFRCARDFAAWIGLTPKDHSTAGKLKLGVITRAGDETLRTLLVCGATAVIQQARSRAPSPWLAELLKRKPPKLAAVALANKTARIAWKLMVSGQRYNPRHAHPQPDPASHEMLKQAA
jgi:transposase